MVDALLHDLRDTRSKPATMLTLVLIPYWAPSTIDTDTVILQDQLFLMRKSSLRVYVRKFSELILGSRDSDYYPSPRMILAKDVPYCKIMVNPMMVKERIMVMDQAVTTVRGGVCKIISQCFLRYNSCNPLGTCIVFL
jgi:hypothetical protein